MHTEKTIPVCIHYNRDLKYRGFTETFQNFLSTKPLGPGLCTLQDLK